MQNAFKMGAAALVLSVAASAAHADVIYDWTTTTGGVFGTPESGHITVSDEAYRAGHLFLNVDSNGLSDPGINYRNNPLIDIDFDFRLANGSLETVDVKPRTDKFFDLGNSATIELTFLPSGGLTGSIEATDVHTQFGSKSLTPDQWSIAMVGSDSQVGFTDPDTTPFTGGICEAVGDDAPCGGTGYFQARALPADVPTPSAWGLFAAGLALIGIGYRSSRRQRG